MSYAQTIVNSLTESKDAEAYEEICNSLSEMARDALTYELTAIAESYGMKKSKMKESDDSEDASEDASEDESDDSEDESEDEDSKE